MTRKYELKIILTAKSDKALEHMEELKHLVLSGQLQRDWKESGKIDKVVASFKELEDESKTD
jgi:hypothetical protein